MKTELNTGRRLLVALCAALLLACAARAQGQPQQGPRAEKLSEYVNQFTSCNAGAHLDNLAIYLQNNPNATGYVRIYGPGGPDNKYGEQAARAIKGYLVDTRGIDEPRVRVLYAGLYVSMEEGLTEVWFLPEGAPPPPPAKRYRPDLDFKGRFVELNTWDGPEEGEGWSNTAEVALVGLSDMMRRRTDARAYLVAYNSEESAPGAWRRAAERQVERLGNYGVTAERVKVIFGGYAKEEQVKVWILPADAPPPARQRRERRPEQSVRLVSLNQFQLNYYERWAFKGLADVLRADTQLTGCLVVRQPPAKVGAVDPATPVDPDEPPDVDVVQLAEKWKEEFKKSGLGEHRLVVMVLPTREGQWGAEFETWVVPPGAPLPDPSADDVINTEEAETENP